jgi:exopolysaccharide biosynthesis WecB/TagA/CpsF family protein
MTAVRDPEYAARLAALELVVADGQPVRWGLNALAGTGLRERVYGPALTLDLCARAAGAAVPLYLFGGTERILERLRKSLLDRFPGLAIAGSRPSRFRTLTDVERQQDLERIRESGARLVFVGLGCPRQEIWVYENRRELGMPCLGVGAAFEFLAGTQRQAPRWMQQGGLEWLFRLVREPRRLWRRYLLLNPAFVLALARELAGARRPLVEPPSSPPEPVRPG